MCKNKIFIDSKYANLDYSSNPYKVTVMGSPYDEDNQYIETIQLLIESTSSKNTFNLIGRGRKFNLYLIDLLNKGYDQILITGQYRFNKTFAITRLYEFNNGRLKMILDEKIISSQINLYSRYLENQTVEIICKNINKKYSIDLNNTYKSYLHLIYDEYNNVLDNVYPSISPINTAYPIIPNNSHSYNLQVQQRIIGVSNSDTLGYIQSLVEIDTNRKLNVKQQSLLLFGENIIN